MPWRPARSRPGHRSPPPGQRFPPIWSLRKTPGPAANGVYAQDYTEAIRLKPDHADAFNNWGNVRRDKGDLDGALQDYTEAIRLKPDYAAAFYNRGNARRAKGDMDGALQDHTEAIRLKK